MIPNRANVYKYNAKCGVGISRERGTALELIESHVMDAHGRTRSSRGCSMASCLSAQTHKQTNNSGNKNKDTWKETSLGQGSLEYLSLTFHIFQFRIIQHIQPLDLPL